MKITIECFGAFRNFGDQISLDAQKGQLVSDLRDLLYDSLKNMDGHFDDRELINRSRFATDTEVLPDTAELSDKMQIVIIPPVSGG